MLFRRKAVKATVLESVRERSAQERFATAANDIRHERPIYTDRNHRQHHLHSDQLQCAQELHHDYRHQSPDVKDWKTLIAESENVMNNASIIGGKIYVTYMKDASDHAYIYTLDGKCNRK